MGVAYSYNADGSVSQTCKID